MWKEGIALALYGRGARSAKYKHKEPLLEELMQGNIIYLLLILFILICVVLIERTKQALSQQAAERQPTLDLVHSCINEFPEKVLINL